MPAFVDGLNEMANSPSAAVQIGRRYSSSKYSLDYDQYLLASSPPGFGYDVFNQTKEAELHGDLVYQESLYHCQSGLGRQNFDNYCNDYLLRGCKLQQTDVMLQNDLSTSKSPKELALSGCLDNVESAKNSEEKSGFGRVKKVSFADDFGLRLTEIKYFFESPDMPPIIKTKAMLQSVGIFQPSQHLTPSWGKAGSVNPLLVPDFPMPISNRVAFAKKIEQDCVSLESLYVATNQTLAGNVKVKNLGYTKRVFVRCSFDCWKTSTDFPCNYLPSTNLEGSNQFFDWFTFVLTVPSNFDTRLTAEFAVCFQCNGEEYWDNNMGTNYHLISPDWSRRDTDNNDENARGLSRWTTHLECVHHSMSWPYW